MIPSRFLAASLMAGAAGLAHAPAQAAPEAWELVPGHAQVIFTFDHFGLTTTYGAFDTLSGGLMLDRENPANSSVEIEIDLTSLDTGFDPREAHFTSADFFDTANHPTATFVSTNVELTGEDTALVTGDLTIKDITLPVTLDVKLNGLVDDNPVIEGTQEWAGFSATTTVDRTQWDLGLFAPAVPAEIDIIVEVEAIRPIS